MKLLIVLILLPLTIIISGCCCTSQNNLKIFDKGSATYKNNNELLNITFYSLSDKSLYFVKVEYNKKTYTLPQVLSADGAKYTDDKNLMAWIKGNKLFLEKFTENSWSKRKTFYIVK